MLDVTDVPVHRFTNDEFDELARIGAFDALRVELADGLIVDRPDVTPEHANVVRALTVLLGARLDLLSIQNAIAPAEEGWRPQPDVVLAPLAPGAHPVTAHLVVEVSVTTHAHDRSKVGVYLRAGVPRVWLVDVPGRAVTTVTADGHETVRGEDVLDACVEGIAAFTVAELFATAGIT